MCRVSEGVSPQAGPIVTDSERAEPTRLCVKKKTGNRSNVNTCISKAPCLHHVKGYHRERLNENRHYNLVRGAQHCHHDKIYVSPEE